MRRDSDSWSSDVRRFNILQTVVMVVIALIFGVLAWGVVMNRGNLVQQEEHTMGDGRKVTCFTTFYGRMPTMQCIPNEEKKHE